MDVEWEELEFKQNITKLSAVVEESKKLSRPYILRDHQQIAQEINEKQRNLPFATRTCDRCLKSVPWLTSITTHENEKQVHMHAYCFQDTDIHHKKLSKNQNFNVFHAFNKGIVEHKLEISRHMEFPLAKDMKIIRKGAEYGLKFNAIWIEIIFEVHRRVSLEIMRSVFALSPDVEYKAPFVTLAGGQRN